MPAYNIMLMKILPVLLLLLYFFMKSGNSDSIKNLISGADLKSLSPVLSLLGVDENILNAVSSDAVKDFLSGKSDIKSLISLLAPIIASLLKKRENSDSAISAPLNGEKNGEIHEGLSPIRDLAGEEIYSTLGNYFNS